MKYKTVREGEKAVVFNHLGEGRLLEGPKRVFLFRERLQYLKRVSANPYQYLVVKSTDGFVKHISGPCEIYENPLEHQSVHVLQATKIDASHCIVVYQRCKDNTVARRIIQGPTVFVPSAEEWVHQFKWHGSDPNEKGRMIRDLNKFEQVPCIGNHFYYDVRDVRTSDDTMIEVHLMIFYVLNDIIKMLEATHDPIGDMINAMCSDIISFSGQLNFEQFLQKTQKLSDLASYPQLTQRADRVGYSVSKVVYRGYTASPQLQSMQDAAIQSRTKLRLNSTLEVQRQKLADYKLQKEEARTQLRQDMELGEVKHNQEMENRQQEHRLELQQLKHEAKLLTDTEDTNASLAQEKSEQEYEQWYLNGLKDVGVDLTSYLLNQADAPINQEIRIEGGAKSRATAI